MGRKKKVVEESEEKSGFPFEDILHSDAKRSIAAVFLLAFSVLFLLAFFHSAGLFGVWLDKGCGIFLGFGKWLFPLLLLLSGIMFLTRRTTTLADAVKFIGLLTSFFALLGLLHLYQGGGNIDSLIVLARQGEGGGFVGFALSYVLLYFTGALAGTIIAFTLFLIGIIAAFNVSLIHCFEYLREKIKSKHSESEVIDESLLGSSEMDPSLGTQTEVGVTAPETVSEQEMALEENNIRNVQFHDEEEKASLQQEEKSEEVSVEKSEVSSRHQKTRRRGYVRWELPPVDLLESTSGQAVGGDTERNKHIIQSTLKYFGIQVEPGEVRVGPTVTQYTFRPAFGVKLSRITTLSNDLALALAAQSIRIEAPIPGQSLIGIEIPNKSVATVRLKAILESKEFHERKSDLTLVLGQDVAGKHVLADLRKMPHLLIAGRTGSGKSVCINTLLLSLLYQNSPEDLKLILVDPKRVELSTYKGIPHLRTDVIVENKKVVNVLRWAVGEMEHRYKVLEEVHARDLFSYREKCVRGETKTTVDAETGKVREESLESLPYIVIVIDEMADLMVAHGKEVEALIIRLAQMSRAIGIHLILATQRPSVEVLTGLIKANIPTRVAFQVTTQIDSRTILDSGGAEKLLGNGDMLYASSEGTEMKRLQGVFVSDDEVKRVTAFLRKQKEDLGEDEIGEDLGGTTRETDSITAAIDALDEGSKEDDLYEEAKRLVVETGRASTTYLQTALGIGYPRGARLMHLLEQNGVVGIVEGKKKVLLSKSETAPSEIEEKKYGDDAFTDQTERDKWQL
ncbi:MAG: DNA translocase FtsK 4TM domain-containing protein [Candidatus Moranbacteria bacterium]|nr:DNA translocase FtsK 4TM domain-containing protein [Candidatus Moranbacteria bacterium]